MALPVDLCAFFRGLLSTLLSILLAALLIVLLPLLCGLLSNFQLILFAATRVVLLPLFWSLLRTFLSTTLAMKRVHSFVLFSVHLISQLATRRALLCSRSSGVCNTIARKYCSRPRTFALIPFHWRSQSPFLSVALATILVYSCTLFCRMIGTLPTFTLTFSL